MIDGWQMRILETIEGGVNKLKDMCEEMEATGRGLDKPLQHLRRNGYISYSGGVWALTQHGRELLEKSPERQAKKMVEKMGEGKPTYDELVAFVRLYMLEDEGCDCHLCPVARRLLERIDGAA